jgi:hypothetical protein
METASHVSFSFGSVFNPASLAIPLMETASHVSFSFGSVFNPTSLAIPLAGVLPASDTETETKYALKDDDGKEAVIFVKFL